ncbi:MAG: hypothetical protein U5L96_16700 [Owenweeksia sp.]|nr:hypothetical protein [Owenweeksia sp.]
MYGHDANINILDLTVDGDGQGNTNHRYFGIGFNNAGGNIRNVEVSGVRHTPLNGAQGGNGIFVNATSGSARTIHVDRCTVYDYQKTGMIFSGADLTAMVDSNTVTGAGPLGLGLPAQNGIQFYGTNGGNITNNTISDIRYTENSYVASGIITFFDLNPLTITGNSLNEVEVGFYGQGNNAAVTANTFDGGDYGLYSFAANGEATLLDAQNNFSPVMIMRQ